MVDGTANPARAEIGTLTATLPSDAQPTISGIPDNPVVALDCVTILVVGPGSQAPMPTTPRDRYLLRPVLAGGWEGAGRFPLSLKLFAPRARW